MRSILTRDFYMTFSKNNIIFLLIIIIFLCNAFLLPIDSEHIMLKFFGFDSTYQSASYLTFCLCFHFYFIWFFYRLYTRDISRSSEFLWLRISPHKWMFYKSISILIMMLLLQFILFFLATIVGFLRGIPEFALDFSVFYMVLSHFSILGLCILIGEVSSVISIILTILFYTVPILFSESFQTSICYASFYQSHICIIILVFVLVVMIFVIAFRLKYQSEKEEYYD